MAIQIINVGSSERDGTGDRIRASLIKANENFAELNSWANYVANRWYLPINAIGLTPGANPGLGSIRLFPGFIRSKITIDNLGFRNTSGANNVQAAIYASDASTFLPTGNALVSTGTVAVSGATAYVAAASLQLGPGLYWFASNCDGSNAVLISCTTNYTLFGQQIGSSAGATATQLGQVLGAGAGGMSGLSVAQTYGTWPDLTSASFTWLTGSATVPMIAFHIASVP